VCGLVAITGYSTREETDMNLLDPRIAQQEIDRRLRAAEHRRRVRWARASTRNGGDTADLGYGEQ
jgi:hypothetical protein